MHFKHKKALTLAVTLCVLSQSIAFANSTPFRDRIMAILHPERYQVQEEMPAKEVGNDNVESKDNVDQIIEENEKYRKQLEQLLNRKEEKENVNEKNDIKLPEIKDESDTKKAAEQTESVLQLDLEPTGNNISTMHQNNFYYSGSQSFTPAVQVYENPLLDRYVDNTANENTALFEYKHGQSYNVDCEPGYVTDIQLKAGENIENISIGDNQRWITDVKFARGNDTWHVYVRPISQGVETNMIIVTNERTYNLTLYSGGDYAPIVSWYYPGEGRHEIKPEGVAVEVENVDQLNFDYQVSKGRKFAWTPQTVFDDGFKTYLVLKDKAAMRYTPAVFQKRAAGQLIHLDYRVINDTIVIDKVCNELYICTSNDDYVLVKNKKADNPWG